MSKSAALWFVAGFVCGTLWAGAILLFGRR